MFKKFLLTSFLVFGSFITIYPSKKENTHFFDYCFSLEKIISRNSVEKSKNISTIFKPYLQDITSFGSNKSKGATVNSIIDRYKSSKKSNIINFVPNKFYCLAGYWIESVSPGTFQSIIYEKSRKKINQYQNTKKELDAFIKNINTEYDYLKKELNNFF